VTYPDDIQIAINRGWFTLSGSDFQPDKSITSAEATKMLNDAKSVIANDGIDENYDSKYEFADDVIIVPQTANVTIDTDYTVTIENNETQISEGDTFVVYNNGYPVVLKALSVTTEDDVTVISSTKVDADEAVTSADSEGEMDIDLEDFEFNELTTYSVTDTSKPNAPSEDLTFELQSIDYDKSTKTLTASQSISLGSSAAGTVTVKMSNLKLSYKEKNKNCEAFITADTNVTTAISFDLGSYIGIPSSLTLGYINIAGIGSITLAMEYSIKGGVSMSWDGELKAGFSYNNGNFRLIKNYTKKGFTFTAEGELKAGLKLSAAIDLLFAKGSIYGTVGVKMSFLLKSYDSGTPKTCVTIKGYMYAAVGADVTVLWEKAYDDTQNIFTEYNSPVRVVYHYEDNVLVTSCSRGQSLSYYTSTSSKYFNPSQSYGQGSYSGGEGAEPVVIWEYEVDDDGNATITGYKGNASAIAVPSTIDGYTVTKIGDSAFEDNKSISSVTIPDSVKEIGVYVFKNCISLTDINLSSSLSDIGIEAFYNCDSLTSITLPKSISNETDTSTNRWFAKCDNLKTVTFEEGTTYIPEGALENAESVTTVYLPITIIKIGNYAFYDCEKLKDVYYSGDEMQWKAILIENDNSSLKSATIHYLSNNKVIDVTGITLDRTSGEIVLGTDYALTAQVLPANATNQNIAWTSSDETVATVNNGVVTAVTTGTATIAATTEDGGYTAECAITVIPKTEITSFTVDNSGAKPTANLSAVNVPDTAVVYIAAYDGTGALLGVQTVELENGNAAAEFDVTDAAQFKAFVWYASSMLPLVNCSYTTITHINKT
jgi:hypothetical protein